MQINSSSNGSVELDLIKSSKLSYSETTTSANGNSTKKSLVVEDSVNIDMKGIYKSLTVFADEVLKKLDDVLKNDLPDGIRSLNPEEHTSEKTADRIVSGVLGLYSAYQKQNPDKTGEELIKSFLQTVKGGIKQGHDDAMGVLGDIGALDFQGVSEGIAKTMDLVESKLNEWEKTQMENLKTTEDEAAANPED